MKKLEKIVGTQDWHAEITPGEDVFMSFYMGAREVLRVNPVKVNQLSEDSALVGKSRLHHTVDGLSASVDVENKIPFGAEPKIKRSVDFADGFARVITDVQPGKHDVIRFLEMDSLELPGPWARIAVQTVPAAGKSCSEPEWIYLGVDSETFFNGEEPFLNVLLEDHEGNCIETGLGDDIWRWANAKDMELTSAEFRISGNADLISITRKPLSISEEADIQARAWRYKWYFAWSFGNDSCEASCDNAEIIDSASLDLPDVAEIQSSAGTTGTVCFEAPATRKKMRKLLRSLTAAEEERNIVLINSEPHVCCCGAHLERRDKQLLHWDAWDLMELFVWGNRKMSGMGAFSIICPDSSAAKAFPLMKCLKKQEFQRISGM
jgi:hypothetical protein